MCTTLVRLSDSLISPLTLWPNIPTLDAAKIPLDRQRPKRECKYQIEWRSHRVYPSRKGPTFAFCESCGVDINVGHGGLNDVRKHLATSKHQEMLKATSGTSSLKALFRPSPLEESITRAELLFASFIPEHNLLFMLADHFTHLSKAMFPDSQIAKGFRCAATKTTCIVKGALNPYFLEAAISLWDLWQRKSVFNSL